MERKDILKMPKIAFGSLIDKYRVSYNDIVRFKCNWHGVIVEAYYVSLPKSSSVENPTLMLLDLSSVEERESRLLLLQTEPIFSIDCTVDYDKLDIFGYFAAGEIKTDSKYEDDSLVEPYFEVREISSTILAISKTNSLVTATYFYEIAIYVIGLYKSPKYTWSKSRIGRYVVV